MSLPIPNGGVPGGIAEATTARAVARVTENPVAYGEQPKEYLADESAAVFLKYIGLFLKYRTLVAIICAGFLVMGLVITFLMPRIYTAMSTVQIDREAAKVVRVQDGMGENANDPQFYATQYELLKSRALAERVVSSLSLADNKDFVNAGGGVLGRLEQMLFAQRSDSEPENMRRQRLAVELLKKGLTIQPIPLSRLVRISFSFPNPYLAQRISVAFADNFVAMTLDRRFSTSSYARTFLEEKLQQLKVKLEESEKQVVAYAEKEGIVNVDDKASVAGANLKAMNELLAAVTAERIKNEQLWAQARVGDGSGLPQVLSDKLIEKARGRRTELVAEYQDKLKLMKPDFPEMKELRAKIDEYDREIRTQINFVKQTIKAQYEASRDQEASFVKAMATLKSEVLDLRNRSIQYNILQRELDTNCSLYDGLLQQYKEVGVTGAVSTNNVSIIDKAELPRSSSSPSFLFNLPLALFLGLLASAATIAVRELFDDFFKVPEEVEEMLGLTVLGVIPLKSESVNILQDIIRDPLSAPAEAFRSLRTSLQFSTASGAPKILLVTSSQPGEGKSTTSVSLAVNFTQLGMQVLLIDADLRKATLHKIFAVDNAVGLSNVLTGAQDASQVVHQNVIEGITLMPSGPLPPNPAELIAGPQFASLLATAREKFDIVIIDGPPVMGLADAPLLGSLVDGTLVVVDSSATRRRVVRAAVRRLNFSRTRILGVLFNKFDSKKAGHTYGYGYGGTAYHDTYGSRDTEGKAVPSVKES